MEIKRLMRYLNGTEEYGLWYKKGGNLDLKAFTNPNWAGSVDDRKRASGGALFLGKRLVSWTSKKKNCIFQYTTKEEYVATTINFFNVVWFKQLLDRNQGSSGYHM